MTSIRTFINSIASVGAPVWGSAVVLYLFTRFRFSVFVEDREASAAAAAAANFRRLVLGCTDSYDSEQRRVFQHFSKSTRFAFEKSTQDLHSFAPL